MRSLTIAAAATMTPFASALCEVIQPAVALVNEFSYLADMIEIHGEMDFEQIDKIGGTGDLTLLPSPTAPTNDVAEKPPGKWTDEQQLSLETFKEIVATDVENVWVIAYIDPRCRDCIILSLEWDKLTQIEEKEQRKIKLGFVDISVEENWKIVQDHTKGKKMTHTPAVTLYGENKEAPYWYPDEEVPEAEGIHTWVSDYADSFGYGYWDPDQYAGAGVKPFRYGNKNSDQYRNFYNPEYDTTRHNGSLAGAGVPVGPDGGRGY